MTGIGYHPDFLQHDPGATHIESPWRLESILHTLHENLPKDCAWMENFPKATSDNLRLAHDPAYIETVLALHRKTGQLDHETIASPGTIDAALRAAGGGIAMSDAVLAGTYHNGFLLCRPPGHHAGRNFGMGFCFFNNIAIAAKHLLEQRGLKRVAIIDIDIHHGNGTEDIVTNDPRIFFTSIHQQNLFPHNSGNTTQNNILNIPLPNGTTDQEFQETIIKNVLPAITTFAPECILISCGFDGHQNDPIGGWKLSTDSYREATQQFHNLAEQVCHGRLVTFLEGGYAADRLGDCAKAVLSALNAEKVTLP